MQVHVIFWCRSSMLSRVTCSEQTGFADFAVVYDNFVASLNLCAGEPSVWEGSYHDVAVSADRLPSLRTVCACLDLSGFITYLVNFKSNFASL